MRPTALHSAHSSLAGGQLKGAGELRKAVVERLHGDALPGHGRLPAAAALPQR